MLGRRLTSLGIVYVASLFSIHLLETPGVIHKTHSLAGTTWSTSCHVSGHVSGHEPCRRHGQPSQDPQAHPQLHQSAFVVQGHHLVLRAQKPLPGARVPLVVPARHPPPLIPSPTTPTPCLSFAPPLSLSRYSMKALTSERRISRKAV